MFRFRPSFMIALSFLLVILSGAILLSLPVSSASGAGTSFLDSFFTANSATCVTGLVTLDTGTHFSLFGLLVILLLIQVGGLGYMTISIFMALLFRRRLFISQKLVLQQSLNISSTKDVINVMSKIFWIVFTVEGIGALILFIRWLPEMGFGRALFYGVFHSVSAFNNAGFSLPANFASLSHYVTDPIINFTITSLVLIGGIGFIAIAEILGRKRFSLHSKVVMLMTMVLVALGTILILFLEYNNVRTIGTLNFPDKLMASYFHAVTPRTAGFNTLHVGSMFTPTLLFIMFLMFIGASPGGTGGGVKTTTFALVVSTIWSTLKGSKNTIMFGRRVPADTIRRAFTIICLALAVISVAIFCLDNVQSASLMEISFEVFSAFSTVGLSMGITPYLGAAGKIIIIIVMFVGRVGPLSLLLALAAGQREPKVELPKEGISIG